MTEAEFKDKYQLTDDQLRLIKLALKIFKGKLLTNT